jgi:hypothetical protein
MTIPRRVVLARRRHAIVGEPLRNVAQASTIRVHAINPLDDRRSLRVRFEAMKPLPKTCLSKVRVRAGINEPVTVWWSTTEISGADGRSGTWSRRDWCDCNGDGDRAAAENRASSHAASRCAWPHRNAGDVVDGLRSIECRCGSGPEPVPEPLMGRPARMAPGSARHQAFRA